MKKIIIPLFEEFIIGNTKLDTNQDKYSEIPEDCGMSKDDIEEYTGNDYNVWYYFGDCKNTVDIDKMWDATEMSDFIRGCKLYVNNNVPHFLDGDREIPESLKSILEGISNLSQIDLSQIVFGIDEYQKIGFIYVTSEDTHYFFDIK